MIKIINDTDREMIWAVRVIREGNNYGLDNCLIHKEQRPLVEFYDCRYEHTDLGQFVSRYYVETLLDRQPDTGLCLHGGVPDWNIDVDAMNRVIHWLKTITKETT
jgi:hypothetical protein